MLDDLSSDQQAKIALYQQEILHWNRTVNLIGRSTVASFVEDHLNNSLEILPFLKGELPLLDIGTGGGLPGIPLAIALPDREVILTEVDQKKLAFLRYVVARLRLPNVRVVDVQPSTVFPMPCDVVSRAYGPLSRILFWTEKHAPRASSYYILKGASYAEELKEVALSSVEVHSLSKGVLLVFRHPDPHTSQG